MSNSPTTSVPEAVSQKMISYLTNNGPIELVNTFRDMNVSDLKEYVEAMDLESHGDRRELEGRLAVWERLKGRQGLYMNAEGNLEINPEYIQERIDELESQKEKL